ncbi:MAG: UbiA family prenyltransferase [Methanobacteriaceae archaeon]|jgi:geranylgeranylglycerol-phosphate geranylgeranyltransferase|nr:UbiA family prenyltransferase [Candidatus Methanorudis spinitermitis]
MNVYLEIIRPGNAVMAVIAVILMGIIGQNYNLPLILGTLAVFLATGGGNVINDYFDHKIDAINKPKRPIPSGRISLKNAYIYASLLFGVAVIFGILSSYLLDNYIPTLIVALSSLLMYYYGKTLKKIALIGNIVVSFLTGLCFIFAGVIIGLDTSSFGIIYTSLYLGFFAILMTMAREITKDMEDIEGDKLEGAKTFPIIYGNKVSSIVTGFLMVIAIVLSPILYLNGIFNIYFLIVLLLAIATFLYGVYKILKDQRPENCKNVSKLIKIGMMIIFISFAIGSF